MWIGNILVAKNEKLRMTVVVDGQAEGLLPLVEVHNPTEQTVSTQLASPPHAPLFGGISTRVKVPAGDSIWLVLESGRLKSRD